MFSKLLLAMTLVGVANAQTCGNADGAGGGALSCLTNSQADSGATGTSCTGACTTAKDNDKCCTANAGYFSDATAGANAVTQCTVVTNAATVTCTSASDSVIVTCNNGFWKNGTACQACTTVTGAKSDATYTCTSASDSRVSACAASSTTKKTVGGTGAMDTCTATCADGTWDNANTCTTCTAVSNAATVTCTSASNSVAVTCNAGSWKNGTACDTCTAVTNAATVTCTNATNSVAATCLDGYTAGTDLKCQPKPEPEPEPAAPSPSPASAEGLGSGSSSSGSMATPAVAMTSLVAMLAYLVQ
jgi:hypothetical protein